MKAMRGLILAAGLGTRLGELTKTRPKALIEVAGRPVIDYVVERLINSGVTEIAVNLHYFPELIIAHLANFNNQCEFHFSYEPELLDTGGAIKNLRNFLTQKQNFILHNCDIITDYSLDRIINIHLQNNALGTLAVSPAKSARHLLLDQHFRLKGIRNTDLKKENVINLTSPLTAWDYHCMAVFNSELLKYTDSFGPKFGLFELLLNAAQDQKIIGTNIEDSKWIDIGTPLDLERAQLLINRGS